MPNLIGLSGYARTGKDTAATVLVGAGFTRVAFADKLREFLYAQNPTVATYTRWGWEVYPLRVIIDAHGWDGYKNTVWHEPVRELLQRTGKEAGRDVLGGNIWVDAALNRLHPWGGYVFTDVRFPNEANAIRSRGGLVVRIEREGFGPANNHPSETSLDDYPFDFTIWNNGDLVEYAQAVKETLC